ncbi:hypothetical protein [Microbacterium sp.]|uniref:hypothetical protein n=1 Tax=Microbacterium sp. TaxID=51671 RepID=UPI001ACB13D7|nr:hypothetical protein [Microbacterium sp.]MBN9187779.1 hypothetical protein [Microbacterium sp.]MBN9193976.1 hypothetical protein [Microbacterium sp.]
MTGSPELVDARAPRVGGGVREPRWGRVVVIGVGCCVVLIAAAMLVPYLTGWQTHAQSFPPLHARLQARVGPGTPAALLLGVLAVVFAPRATTWRWGRLLIAVFAFGVAWMVSLAAVDGVAGLGSVLESHGEYLQTARRVDDAFALLHGYIARIPLHSPGHWPTHLAGHPPGAVLFFVLLVRVGLGSALAAGLAVIVIAATTAVAVLVTLRRLGAEGVARRAAPFLAAGPAAIWMGVSADAVFAATAAWAACALAVAVTSPTRARMLWWGALAGVLFGWCVMFSYGLPLLGVLALAMLWRGRSWLPLVTVVVGGATVVLAFAAAGFAWWDALPVLQRRYWDGIASSRPGAYWTWADLAALSVSAGPWVGAGVAAASVETFGRRARAARAVGGAGSRARATAAILTLAVLTIILLADLSQMSRAEVERIWLPFVPWLLASIGLLPAHWRRVGIIVQVVFALAVQHLIWSQW